MKLLLTLITVFPMSVFAAAGYDLSISFMKNGEALSNNRLIVKAGREGKVTKTNKKIKTELTVIADEGVIQKNKGILLKMGFKHWDDKQYTHTKPEALVSNGKEAIVEIYDNQNHEKTMIKIVATRVDI